MKQVFSNLDFVGILSVPFEAGSPSRRALGDCAPRQRGFLTRRGKEHCGSAHWIKREPTKPESSQRLPLPRRAQLPGGPVYSSLGSFFPLHSGVSTASTTPRARRFNLRRLGHRKRQQQQQQQEQLLLQQEMQAALQQEEALRDDDEVEALGASTECVGHTIESTKVKYQWLFRISGVDHVVEFYNSKLSGRKKIFMDKRLIYTQQQLRAAGFEYSWPCSGHLLSVFYDSQRQSFCLTVNGLPFHLFYRRSDMRAPQYAAPSRAPVPSTSSAAAATGQYQQQQLQHQQLQQQLLQQQYQLPLEQPQQPQQPYQEQPHQQPQQRLRPHEHHSRPQQRQQQQQQAAYAPETDGLGQPPSSSRVPDDVDLLDLVSSSTPSSPYGASSSAGATAGAAGVGGPFNGPSSYGVSSRAPSSAGADLAQLDGAFWSGPPATPEFPGSEGPSEGHPAKGSPLPDGLQQPPATHLPQAAFPSGAGPLKQPQPASSQEQSSFTGGVRIDNSKREETLFAGLMQHASERLQISLSPQTKREKPKL